MKLMFKVPSVALFKPIINRLQGLCQLFYIYSVNMAYLPPLFLPLQLPSIDSWLSSSLPILTASGLSYSLSVPLSDMQTSPLSDCLVWFAVCQTRGHTYRSPWGLSTSLCLYITALSLFLSLPLQCTTEPFRNGARDWS